MTLAELNEEIITLPEFVMAAYYEVLREEILMEGRKPSKVYAKDLETSNSNVVNAWAKEYGIPKKELSVMWKNAEVKSLRGGTVVYPIAMTIFKNMVKHYYQNNGELKKHLVGDLGTKTKTSPLGRSSGEAVKAYKKELKGAAKEDKTVKKLLKPTKKK